MPRLPLSPISTAEQVSPREIFPFAGTPTGEHICFDYRARPSSPQIVFVTVEAFIYPVAESLTDFLNKLHN